MPRRPERVRPDRVAEQIRMDAADILQNDVKDPRVRLVTVTRVQLTRDLASAKLYVSVLGDESERVRVMKALEGATGYVRRRLAERLRLRTAPEIRFVYDPSVEYGIRLEKLLEETGDVGEADEDAAGDGEEEPTDG
jgi:ribosome-binding factor A